MARERSERGLTDECHVLSTVKLARDGVFKKEAGKDWTSIWKNEKGMTTSSIGFSVQADSQGQLVLQLKYDWSDTTTNTRLPTEYPVKVTTTPGNIGGATCYWFVCPLSPEGGPCKRRVGRLYLPAGERHFGCRTCYNLMYRSQREYDKEVAGLMGLPSEELLDNFGKTVKILGTIMRALNHPSKKRIKREREKDGPRDVLEMMPLHEIVRKMGLTGRARREFTDSISRRVIENLIKQHHLKK